MVQADRYLACGETKRGRDGATLWESNWLPLFCSGSLLSGILKGQDGVCVEGGRTQSVRERGMWQAEHAFFLKHNKTRKPAGGHHAYTWQSICEYTYLFLYHPCSYICLMLPVELI